jgi:aspartokinase-like uncharacterized kinase
VRRVVVKLGGSTADQAELGSWLAALAASSLPVVVVPGGGPFANLVRDAQKRMGFSDAAAHAMAILAMDQFGHVILDRQERFVATRLPGEMERVLKEGKIPVWLPSALTLSAAEIPASWDITSDSLAAWLAEKINAEALLLIKQSSAFSERDGIDDLTAKGIVDAGFAEMLPDGVDFYLAGPQDAAMASAILSAGKLPGIRMRLGEAALERAG